MKSTDIGYMSIVNYRWLDGPTATDEDWQRIEDVLVANKWMSLNRNTTRIRIAETEDGDLVGFSVFQMLPHCGPIYVEKEYRGGEVTQKLADDTIEFLMDVKCRGWIVVADTPHSEKLAKDRGMVKLKSPVYITRSEEAKTQ